MFKVWGISLVLALLALSTTDTSQPDWALNATTIEACSCPMFCQCYFNTKPAAHHEHGTAAHYCQFNNAYKVNHGHYGSVNLDGAKFWITGDLGGDFSQGKTDWALVTFDKAMTKEQQSALGAILPNVFPVKWNSFQTAVGNIDTWEFNKDEAHATIDGGKTAEVKLHRFPGNTDDPVVIHNLKYWGTPRNDGFVMMPNDVETYKTGPKPFEYKGTNGFMLTLDMASTDLKP
ncbi:MAG: DUF1326 domain-containing protein [Candidatus Sulfotelmatobacter sp.]